jgi:hypothetical protein
MAFQLAVLPACRIGFIVTPLRPTPFATRPISLIDKVTNARLAGKQGDREDKPARNQ